MKFRDYMEESWGSYKARSPYSKSTRRSATRPRLHTQKCVKCGKEMRYYAAASGAGADRGMICRDCQKKDEQEEVCVV